MCWRGSELKRGERAEIGSPRVNNDVTFNGTIKTTNLYITLYNRAHEDEVYLKSDINLKFLMKTVEDFSFRTLILHDEFS